MATEPILAAIDGVVRPRSYDILSLLSDYWSLTKPEINLLIAITTGCAFCLGSPASLTHLPWLPLLRALVGTVLVASGAAALNQLIELRCDAQMRRTACRPIPAGRIKPRHALVFGTVLALAGGCYLGLTVRPSASLLALLTLGWYLFLYTPLKRRTPLCTLVGALAGATPALIGYVAVTGKLASRAWLLYAILFFWQFPHFMAIAWMYREDYARAGYLVLPPGKRTAQFMGWQSVLPALILLFVTVAAMVFERANPLFTALTLLLSLGFLYLALRLAIIRSRQSASRLLLVSVIYLPLVFTLQVLARI